MIAQLHYITHDPGNLAHAMLAEKAIRGGVRWVQLRVKNADEQTARAVAARTLDICRKHGAKMIVNDHVLLAKEIGADGVHIGLDDMPVSEARSILGDDFIIGATANTIDHIRMHAKAGADYIGLGPFRFTTTKEKLSPVLGVSGYKLIMQQLKDEDIHIPVIAIGGITEADVMPLLGLGVHGVAVSSAIGAGSDVAAAAKRFIETCKLT
jgi:thiamine-phosphate pyrophosphorylase